MNEENQNEMIKILLDADNDISFRDDIAMDLSKYDDPETLKAFRKVASKHDEAEMVSESCGESIGEIWARQSFFDLSQYKKFNGSAKDGVIISIRAYKPAWIEKYDLE
ncbi:MAG: hypothetical protein SNF33_02360 [Candidatus Algichlamydia australiensis]|nr:hypothetical protein [Chlamydiales bacterium]